MSVQVSLTAIEGAGVFVWESAMQTESTPPHEKNLQGLAQEGAENTIPRRKDYITLSNIYL